MKTVRLAVCGTGRRGAAVELPDFANGAYETRPPKDVTQY